jgi:Ca-activated chloride channel family protein
LPLSVTLVAASVGRLKRRSWEMGIGSRHERPPIILSLEAAISAETMKFLPTTSLLVGLALLLPVVWAHDTRQELTSARSAAQSSGRPQPAAPPAAPSQTEAVFPPKITSAHASGTEPAQSGATMAAAAQTGQSQNAAAKSTGSSAPAKPNESVFTVRKTVSEVHLIFTVTDKHGNYIKNLKKNDFTILDDRMPPEEILSFSSETDLPLQVGLLIDASESVSDRFKFEQEAAVEFLKQTIRRKYDLAFVIGFDLTPKVMQDFTDDTEKLSVGIRALRPSSLTAMYDALYYACQDKLLKQPQAGPVRRAIILLSDGKDNASSVTREKAIEMAQRAEVSVYTISTNQTRSGGHGNKTLERIAEATGGRSYLPSQLTEVANAFAAIQEELRSQYAVSYKPAAFRPDGHYRTIEVHAQKQRGLRIHSRKGYRSPAEYDAPNQ